jgi:hypothetical protein
MATVSVIIPLYNKGRYVQKTLDSILAQTYRDFEVVVVDDGSTDEGPAIVESCGDSRIRLIRQANAGPGAARNRGVHESGGTYVTFLDADDEWCTDFLAANVSIVTRHPEVEVITCSWFQDSLWDGRRNVDMVEYHRSLGMPSGVWKLKPGLSERELEHIIGMFWTGAVFCRRQAVEACGGFYAKNGCRFLEETYLWLNLVCRCTVYRNYQALAHYHNASSELALGGYRTRPLEPFMTDPDPLRQNCPAENRALLETWLAMFALQNAHNRAAAGKTDEARFLVRQFPLMRTWAWSYAKLRFKLMCPHSISVAQAVKRRVLGHD